LKKWPGEFPRRAFLSMATNRFASPDAPCIAWLTAIDAMMLGLRKSSRG
jgi:hypothetical protein